MRIFNMITIETSTIKYVYLVPVMFVISKQVADPDPGSGGFLPLNPNPG
jgi:hypothetical protein